MVETGLLAKGPGTFRNLVKAASRPRPSLMSPKGLTIPIRIMVEGLRNHIEWHSVLGPNASRMRVGHTRVFQESSACLTFTPAPCHKKGYSTILGPYVLRGRTRLRSNRWPPGQHLPYHIVSVPTVVKLNSSVVHHPAWA